MFFDPKEVPNDLRDCFEEIQVTCGAPWARVVEKAFVGSYHDHGADGTEYGLRQGKAGPASEYDPGKTLGWRPTCRCPEQEPRPGLVLDPFSGSARTGLTAIRMGLDYVGVELSPIYVEMSRKLLREDSPLFAGGVE